VLAGLAAASSACSVLAPATPATLSVVGWAVGPLAPDPTLTDLVASAPSCQFEQPAGDPMRPLIQDRRMADMAVFIVESNNLFGSCLLQRGSGGGAPTGGGSSGPLPSAPFDAIAIDSGGTEVLDRGAGIASYRGGRADAGVATVRLLLADGRAISATVSHRWWLASWQGDARATKLVATDASGTTLGTIENPK